MLERSARIIAVLLVLIVGAGYAPAGAVPVAASAGSVTVTPTASLATDHRPVARVAGSYKVLPDGKRRVTVRSNAKAVKLAYLSPAQAKRHSYVPIVHGVGVAVLSKGSHAIYARALPTRTLRGSEYVRIHASAPPATAAADAAIAVGENHACAIVVGGTVKCWGANGFGQLGDATTTDRPTAVRVKGLTGVRGIAAGRGHTCAVLNSGQVKCWGLNQFGQLGIGTQVDSLVPVAVRGLAKATAISVGRYHSCAVLGSRGLACWGWNPDGQLGDGLGSARPGWTTTPGRVVTIGNATGLSLGGTHSCALLATGQASCWGIFEPAVGFQPDVTTPMVVPKISGALGISSGFSHTCATIRGGTLSCWGNNLAGLDGMTVLNPVQVPGLSGVSATARGGFFNCARLQSGKVQCFGLNNVHQMGDGSDEFTHPAPGGPVPGITGAVGLDSGILSSCAVRASGQVRCWGANQSGQLGDGTTEARSTPVIVAGVSAITG